MMINKDTSYMIGLFQTDGSLSKGKGNKGKFQLEISVKDEAVIYKLKEIIPFHCGIRKRKRNITLNNHQYDNNETIILSVCDQNFRKFLVESGVPYGKKSKIINPPHHLQNLSISDYVRGLYDGDGSLGLTKKNIPYVSFTTDSDQMATFLTNYICEITKRPLKMINRNKRDNIYNICIFGEDAVILCNTIYYEGCMSLNRKYENSKIIKEWTRPEGMRARPVKKFWTSEQDDFILNHDIEESMEYLQRSERSVKMRLWRLNKP